MNAYIDSRFKWGFIIWFCIGMLFIAILSSFLFFLIIPKEAASLYVPLIYTFQWTQTHLLLIILAVGSFEIILAFLFTLLLSLFLSHKVGGPIFKLECNIDRLRKGDFNLPGISFRDADQGQILAVKFNEMMRSWRNQLREIKYYYCKFAARINILEKNWPHGEECSLETSQMMTRIKDEVEKMRVVLDRFLV